MLFTSVVSVAVLVTGLNAAPVKLQKRQAPAGVPDFVIKYGKQLLFSSIIQISSKIRLDSFGQQLGLGLLTPTHRNTRSPLASIFSHPHTSVLILNMPSPGRLPPFLGAILSLGHPSPALQLSPQSELH
jgi:hypothetical protein